MADFFAIRCIFCLMAGLSWCAPAPAQSEPRDEPTAAETPWAGQWSAEGLPFVVLVQASAGQLKVSPVAPAGQTWVARNGRISDSSATIEIEYQEVKATALIQLMEEDAAIVQALSCQPEFHVICTLARDQRVLFHRLPATAGE